LRTQGALPDGLLKGLQGEDPGFLKDHPQRIQGGVASSCRFPETPEPHLRSGLRDRQRGLQPEDPPTHPSDPILLRGEAILGGDHHRIRLLDPRIQDGTERKSGRGRL
jgi:hypothetical protein